MHEQTLQGKLQLGASGGILRMGPIMAPASAALLTAAMMLNATMH